MKKAMFVIINVMVLVFAFSVEANAQSVVDIFKRINEIPAEGAKALVSFFFLIGLVFAGSAAFTIKQLGMASASNFQTVKNPFYSGLAAILLIYMTTVVGIGGITVFGDGAKDVSAKGDIQIQY